MNAKEKTFKLETVLSVVTGDESFSSRAERRDLLEHLADGSIKQSEVPRAQLEAQKTLSRLHPDLSDTPPGEGEDKEAWLKTMQQKHGEWLNITPSKEFAAKFADDDNRARVAEPAGVSSR